MKKTVSILSISMFLVASAFAGEKMVVASAASSQQVKPVVVKAAKAKPVQKSAAVDVGANYALESFGCCGLPQ